jgi:hypothetical protein
MPELPDGVLEVSYHLHIAKPSWYHAWLRPWL